MLGENRTSGSTKATRADSRRVRLFVSTSLLVMIAGMAQAQPSAGMGALSPAISATDPSINTNLDAAEADGDLPRRRLIRWNEYDGRFITARLGGGFLWDFAGYGQDESSEAQMALSDKGDLRDFRVLLKGQFKFAPRLSYTIGYMYDKAREDWRFRQTGIMAEVPELYGSIFVGRTKEGFSTSKIMVGYQGWTNERAAINDALLPILADGIKWSGYVPSGKFVYNLGWFTDTRSESESFNKNDRQFAARAVWLPFTGTNRGVLHLALEGRFAGSNDGFLQYRSKPEVFQAQSYAIDTGKFAAESAVTIGVETYYRPGPFTIGMEYFFNQVQSDEENDPFFHGGEVMLSYILTGETKPYNLRGGYFERTSPAQTVFEGGPGAWEFVLRMSYADLDSQNIHGGRFWRVTPMVNWHLSDNIRLEFVTGYGVLDRFNQTGSTVFFQSRIQFQL
jgi:phosphate-selective porin OprO and OprP